MVYKLIRKVSFKDSRLIINKLQISKHKFSHNFVARIFLSNNSNNFYMDSPQNSPLSNPRNPLLSEKNRLCLLLYPFLVRLLLFCC